MAVAHSLQRRLEEDRKVVGHAVDMAGAAGHIIEQD